MAETVGSLVDKITIIELKIYHMREQRDDLVAEVTTLVREMSGGRVVPKVYRQFKMYNDPQYRSK